MFTPDPIPRPAGPPASSAPIRDYLASPRPGADAGYVVVPRTLAEAMPLPWQQHMTYLLAEFHQAFSHVTWPTYRVVPSRSEKLVDLDEEQLAEVGVTIEIDSDGEVVYRERSGRIIEHPERKNVLVACLDPIPPPQSGQPQANAPQPSPLPPAPVAPPPPAAGPQDRPWPAGPPVVSEDEPPETPPTGFRMPAVNPAVPPGEPFGPTGYQQRRSPWR